MYSMGNIVSNNAISLYGGSEIRLCVSIWVALHNNNIEQWMTFVKWLYNMIEYNRNFINFTTQ